VLHFRNTSDDRVLSAILERWGVIISPPWLNTLSTGALDAGILYLY